jgi:hypothetical protein
MWKEEMHGAGSAGAEASWIFFIAEIDRRRINAEPS